MGFGPVEQLRYRPLLQFDQQLATLRAQRRIAAVDLEQALGGGIAVRSPDSTVSD